MPDNDNDSSPDPVLRNAGAGKQRFDSLGTTLVDKTGKLQEQFQKSTGRNKPAEEGGKKKGPAGGFDDTPIPNAPPGFTLKFIFHRATNLPFADISSLSSDPYVHATLTSDLKKRHNEDPDMVWRTPTIHRNVNPEWNAEWIVANVPASGCHVKCRIYDEDPSDHDDRLGNVHIDVGRLDESWQGFEEKAFDIKKRMGSKRAYTLKAAASLFSSKVHMDGTLIVSVKNLGRTDTDNGGRMYTIGPLAWTRHFSPLIGRIAGVKDAPQKGKDGKETEKYNFQSIQMQFQGPVPAPLYHRYVEFKPFVAGMFTDHSLRGRILNRALHHQHARIYNFDASTKYGSFEKPCVQLTKTFLDFVHYDQGGRIYTYVLTLDGQWRFTETGKEFGVDLLSKHTMHSDVAIYIAWSGEFFIRRLKHPRKETSSSPEPDRAALPPAPDPEDENREHPEDVHPSKDPSHYELIIDNDSGTYRPNADYLHTLKEYFLQNLVGLRVVTLDCQKDEEKMNKLKDEQRERKKKSRGQMTYMQNKSDSSISSSDEQELDARAGGGATVMSHRPKSDHYGQRPNSSDLDHDDRSHPVENVDGGAEKSPIAGSGEEQRPEKGSHPQQLPTTSPRSSEAQRSTMPQANGDSQPGQQTSIHQLTTQV